MVDDPKSGGRPAMASVVDGEPSDVRPPEERGGAWDKPAIGWAMFEFARNPYYILVIIYIFAPYLAKEVVGATALADGMFSDMAPERALAAANAHGQAFVAGVSTWSGLFAAITAPFLGATLDRGGKRKPFVGLVLCLLGVMSFLLWWAKPGGDGLPLLAIGAILVCAYVCYTYSEVIHNAMLSDSGRPSELSRISGNGLALGNLGATILMVFVIVAFALPSQSGIPFSTPLFGLDATAFEPDRIVGPIAAIWLAIFIWPFFLWCPDAGKKGASWIKAAKEGVAGLIQTVKSARHHGRAMKFLFARMIYADGVNALMALGAVYVAGVLSWSLVELGAYAIWLSIFAVVGGFFAGFLDRVLGLKIAVFVELAVILLILVLLLSITQDAIFYGLMPSVRLFDGNIFSHSHDWFYLGIAALLATFVTALLSTSRSMLVAVAPKKMIGEFFGLYAIAGTATSWAGPLLVGIFTAAFNSQRVGIATIGLFIIGGMIAICFVGYKKGEVAD